MSKQFRKCDLNQAFLLPPSSDGLKLCQQSGLVKLGRVALDGIKAKANASVIRHVGRQVDVPQVDLCRQSHPLEQTRKVRPDEIQAILFPGTPSQRQSQPSSEPGS